MRDRHFGPRHGRWRRNRGLRRQIFFGFAVAIGLTAIGTALVSHLLGEGFKRPNDRDRTEAAVVASVAAVWHDAPARDELARVLARDLAIGVRLVDAAGVELVRAGDRGAGGGDGRACAALRRVAVPRGTVELCQDGHRPRRSPFRALYLLVPAALLWGLAGRWARRLAWPLVELTSVAKDLGEGRLERRSALRNAPGEVGELGRAVNDMAERLERKIKGERELLATVSHELRTPLARVRLLCELGRGATPRDVLTEIEGEAVAMDALVGDLLAGARLDHAAVRLAPVDLDQLVREAVRRHAQRSGRPEVPIDGPAPPPSPIQADAGLLARAVDTLLDNAAKHGGGARALTIAASAHTLELSVDDDGPGFTASDLPRVFEPFFRGHDAPPDAQKGLGLGLAIVKRIAEAHGGRAHAQNRPGGGARVGFTLPIRRAP
jgi:signal transduction histidine kinase